MKKTLIALAALAATGASFAQVTLYGTADVGYFRNDSEGVMKSGLSSSQLSSSKLGVTGLEDIGGGLNAVFKFEGSIAADSGAGSGSNTTNQAGGTGNGGAGSVTQLGGAQGFTFNRYSYVGVSGGFGEVRLGRDYTSTFQNAVAAMDPFGTNGPADSSNFTLAIGKTLKLATVTNASNMIGYSTPDLGGFSAKIQAFFGENASNSVTKTSPTSNNDDGNGYSAQFGYANGPIKLSLAQQSTKGTTSAVSPATLTNGVLTVSTLASTGDYTQRGLGASYDFGSFKIAYTYASEAIIVDTATTTEVTNKSNLLGVVVPFGAANFKASYVRSVLAIPGVDKDNVGVLMTLGVDYALSKRTKVYGAYARSTNDDGNAYGANAAQNTAAKNPSATSYGFGVAHAF